MWSVAQKKNRTTRRMTIEPLEHRTLMAVTCSVTPEKALEYLEKANAAGVRNRSVSDARVKMFEDIIRKGEWRTTHQGIAFDKDGNLIDGQHRLWGCVDSEKPIQVVVTRGVAATDMTLIDRGRSRSQFHMAHEVAAVQLDRVGHDQCLFALVAGRLLRRQQE